MTRDEEIAELKGRIARLERESKTERDRMVGATYHALSTVITQWDEWGYGEALKWAQKQSGLPTGHQANGTYRTMRLEIFDMLVRLDLIDRSSKRFKFEGER